MKKDFLKTSDVLITEDVSFRDMMLSEQVSAGLTKCNFHKPSPIQLRAIPFGRSGLDLLIQSKSGTGKTLVFCTIILERYNPNIKAPQSLIVVPTREIALQVESYLNSIGTCCSGFSVACVIGGRKIAEDRKRISKCKAIVGTPGRLLHLIRNQFVSLRNIEMLVLDEADKLMTDDFYNGINILIDALNENRQIIASSATYENGLDKLIVSFMHNPIGISTSRDTSVLIGVKQFILSAESFAIPKSVENSTASIQSMWRKVSAVEYILCTTAFKQCILFSNSQFRANSFANYLTQNKWTVELILGSHDQNTRTEILQRFRQYKCRILVTSDLMARGIDIVNVNLVINLDVPSDSSTYLHRIGRCGRFGRHGLAITLTSDDNEMLKFQHLLNSIGGTNFTIATFPTNLNRDETFDAWNSSASSDIECDSVFEKTTMNNSTAIETNQQPNENGSECQSSVFDTIEQKNTNLLEVAKLLVDTDQIEQQSMVNIDVDLFDNFQSCSITDSRQSQVDIMADIFEDFAQSTCELSSNELDKCSKLLLGESQQNNESPCNEIKHPIHNQITETIKPTSLKKIHSKAYENQENVRNKLTYKKASNKASKTHITQSTSNMLWNNLYWQQLNDINHYVMNLNCMYK